ncbi:TonB-dependent receptor [Thiosulfatimonas sediminis]|uniref:TonB-dependent receptor n=1 Tax=Thiosulfatimonas sediminis TaxID=2675054 RepID=A0A6F8PY29_9GAMM|nr:TonB-dependent receptor [Thiosulfatimonas sediminis]BBP47029.1 TonB-dependent receptor [Thiosulfatimonas sediminis]
MGLQKQVFKLSLLTSALLAAQLAVAEDSTELKEVVISATKTEVEIFEAPAAVRLISQDEIESKNVASIGDAMTNVPGLSLAAPQLGQMGKGVGAGSFTFRGMDSSRTAVLVDGQSLTDGFSSKVDFRTIMIDDVERIEVVPGAFSSLYGSHAMGGVINVITKDSDEPETTLTLRKGFGDGSGEDIDFYHREKLDNGIGIVFGVGQKNRDGYEDELVVKTPSSTTAGTVPVTGGIATQTATGSDAFIVGDKGQTEWTQNNVTLKLDYDLDANSEVYGGISYSAFDTEQQNYNNYLRDENGNPILGSGLSIDGSNALSLAESDFVASTPLHQSEVRSFIGYKTLIDGNYDVKLELSKLDRDTWYNAKGSPATFYDGTGKYNASPSGSLDGLAQVSFAASENHYIVTGLSTRSSYLDREVWTLANYRNENSKEELIEGVEGDSISYAFFLQDEISVSDNLTLYAGGRYDYWSTQGSNYKTDSGAYENDFSSRSDSAFSPKLSAVYKLTQDVVLRASAGRSFRAPDNYELYGTLYCCGKYYLSNPDLKPETATTYEIGGDWLLNERVKLGATAYHTTIDDMIFGKVLSATEVQKDNAGKARVQGLELTAMNQLTDWLNLSLNYSLIDSEMLENAASPSTEGNVLAVTPERMWSAVFNAQQGDWSGMLQTRFIGKKQSSESNTGKVWGVYGSYGDYQMTDMKVAYQWSKQTKISLAVNNLFDIEAYEYYLLPGRNATLEMKVNF